MTEEDKIYSKKVESYRKDIEQTIEDYKNNLLTLNNAFENIESDKKAREELEKAKNRLEKIVKKAELNEEEGYFIYHELNLNEIFSKYHEEALGILGNVLRDFYFFRDSATSRALDYSAWLAKYLKVPSVKYIDEVLANTPVEYLQKEFEDQLEDKKISKEDTYFLLYKYNLQLPKEELPITKEYKKEVHSKRDLFGLLRRLGLK